MEKMVMRNRGLDNVLRHIRSLVAAQKLKELSDRELVERFVANQDEIAFAAIVERHGSLVLGVCQRILRREHHAEDACQSTFLILARKAGSISKRDSLASWLHGVARRVAIKLRTDIERRAALDVHTIDVPQPDPVTEITWREGLVVLDEELSRLPATYRSALIHFYLEGQTQEEAARALGCSLGAFRGRIERARECLRVRLVRRGVTLSAAALGGVLISARAGAAIPPSLAVGTVRAVTGSPAGQLLAGVVPVNVATLTEGVLATMFVTRMKVIVALIVVGLLVAGAGAVALGPSIPQKAPVAGETSSAAPELVADPVPPAKGRPEANLTAGDERPPRVEQTVKAAVRDIAGKPVAGAKVYWVTIVGPALTVKALPRGQQGVSLKVLVDGKTTPDGDCALLGRFTGREMRELMFLVATAPGYGISGKGFTSAKEPIAIALRPEVKIKGRLLTPAGAPAKGVRVRLESIVFNAQLMEDVGVDSKFVKDSVLPYWPAPVATDVQGCFTLPGFSEEADAYLTIADQNYALENLHVSSRSNVRDGSKPLKPEFTHTLAPARPVQGVVTASDTGKPLASVAVEVWTGNGVPVEGRTDDQGRYRVGMYTATRDNAGATAYHITAYPPADSGYIPVSLEYKGQWPAGAKFLERNLALPRGRLVHGKALDADTNKPLAGVSILYYPKASNPNSRPNYDLRSPVLTDKDGRFTITALAGEGFLLAEAPSPDYIREMIPGLEEGLLMGDIFPQGHTKLNLPKTDAPAVADVKLRKGVTLQAQILDADGKPVPWVFAYYRQMHACQINKWNYAVRFEKGLFRARGCDPNLTYRVFFLQPALHLGAVADLKYEAEPTEIRLKPTATARGKLVQPDGSPAVGVGAEVKLLTTKEKDWRKLEPREWRDRTMGYGGLIQPAGGTLKMKADGTFQAQNLIPGAQLYLEASSPPLGRVRRPFLLEAGETKDLGVIQLPKQGVKE